MKINHYFWCSALLALILSGCGGGGGGGGVAAVVTPPSTTLAPIAFSTVSAPATFTWTTQQATPTGVVQISKADGSVLGGVRVTISNFIETDPTGDGSAIPTMGTEVLATALGDSATAALVTANFGTLTFPSTTPQVLVEVFSLSDGSSLGSAKVDVGQLTSGVVSIVL